MYADMRSYTDMDDIFWMAMNLLADQNVNIFMSQNYNKTVLLIY